MAPSHTDDGGEPEEANESGPNKDGLIGRRGFIKVVGTAAMAVAGTTAMGSARAVDLGSEGLSPGDDLTPYLEEYWTSGAEVHIPGGSYTLSDPDALGVSADENSLLVGDGDVVADHGDTDNNWNLEANGNAHVRIENITLRGKVDGDGGKVRPFPVDDASVVEFVNFNRPDGCQDGTESTGFYVPGESQGTARIVNCHIEEFSDNGLYASSPGKEGMGTTEVYGGLFKNNDTSGVRLGGPNDKAIGVVVVNDKHGPGVSGGNAQRGIRVREPGPVEIRDCDITHLDADGVAGPIEVENESFYADRDGSTVVTHTRIRNDTDNHAIDCESDSYDISGDDVSLTGSGSFTLDGTGPYTNVHEGDAAESPTTEKRLVDPDTLEPIDGGGGGGSSGSDGSGSSDDSNNDGSGQEPTDGSTFEVVAADGGPKFSYEFTADGPIGKVTDDGQNSAEANDSVTDNGDGTYTVTGEVGNGYGDTFLVDGALQAWSATTDAVNYTLYLDGQEVDPADVGGSGDSDDDGSGGDSLPNTIVFDATDGSSGAYAFEVSDELAPDPASSEPENNGTISGSTAEGTVDGDSDGYRFSGDVLSLQLDGNATVVIRDNE